MIEIKPDEAMLLEDTFKGFTDREIIRELVRRKRLRQAQASTLFYPEMRGDDDYMRNIRENVIRSMSRAIADMDVTPTLFDERPAPPHLACFDGVMRPRQPGEMILTADIVFLVARDKKEG